MCIEILNTGKSFTEYEEKPLISFQANYSKITSPGNTLCTLHVLKQLYYHPASLIVSIHLDDFPPGFELIDTACTCQMISSK